MKHKLIIFDLDGTLIDIEFIWTHIHKKLGMPEEKTKEAMRQFKAGEITYQEWLEHDVRMWAEMDVTKEVLLKAIEDIQMMPGTLETLQKLRNTGRRIGLISGSLNFVFEKVFKQHQMLFDHVFINKLVFGEGGRIIGGKATPYDMEAKAEGLVHIAEMEGVDLSETVFVGDHINDVKIAEKAGLSIAFNPRSDELANCCDVIIQNKDLREILKYIE